MNWLHPNKPERALAENRVSAKAEFTYLLANWTVFGFASFGMINAQHGNPGATVMLLVLPALGLVLAYAANRSGDGRDYTRRVVALHFVLGVRFALLAIGVIALGTFLPSLIQNEFVLGWLLGGMMLAVIGGFYFSLARSVRRVAKMADCI